MYIYKAIISFLVSIFFVAKCYAGDSAEQIVIIVRIPTYASKIKYLNHQIHQNRGYEKKVKNFEKIKLDIEYQRDTYLSLLTDVFREYYTASEVYFVPDTLYKNIFKGDNNITQTMNYLDSNLKFSVDQYNKLREVLLSYQSDLANAKGDNQMASAAVTKVENSVDSFIENRQKKEWNNIKTSWLDSLKTNIGIEYVNADSSLQLLVNKAPKLSIAYIWHARVKANFDPTSELGLAKPFYEKFIELAKNDFEKLKNELVEAYSYLGYYYYLQNNNQASLGNWQEVLKIDSENVQAKEAIKQLK